MASLERGALYFLLVPKRLEPPGVDGTACPVGMLEGPILGLAELGLADPVRIVTEPEELDFEWAMDEAGVREKVVDSEVDDRLRLGVELVNEGLAIRDVWGVAFGIAIA